MAERVHGSQRHARPVRHIHRVDGGEAASEAALIRISMHFSWARRDGAGQPVQHTGSGKKGTSFGSQPLLR